MASSTSNIDNIVQSQASKEVTANAFFDAASPATLGGRRQSTTSGLNWGYYGGIIHVAGAYTTVANGIVALTASSTNYVEMTAAGVVSKNTTAFTAGSIALYIAITGTATITSYTDVRDFSMFSKVLSENSTVAMGDANKTLTYAQSICHSIELTGALTAQREVVLPTTRREHTIFSNTTGGFGVLVKTAAGTGISVADGTRAVIACDGTNIVSLSASSLTNPMTTSQDIIVATSGGAPTRLGVGANGTVLKVTAGAVNWGAATVSSQCIPIACSDETTALTAGTAKVTFRMPYAFTLSAVRASLTTAQTSGTIFTVDINEAGTTILSTKLTIDNTEKTSTTAAAAPVISDTSLADDAEITIDIDLIGDGTAKGLKVYLIGVPT